MIPNRKMLTNPKKHETKESPNHHPYKYVRDEVTIFTIGYFAMHTFWNVYRRGLKDGPRNMLAGLITMLVPYDAQRYASLNSHARLVGACTCGVDKRGRCSHVADAKRERAKLKFGCTPQMRLADLLIQMSRAVHNSHCKQAALVLYRIFTAMSRIADSAAEAYVTDALKLDLAPAGQRRQGKRRDELVMRACAEGVIQRGLARTGRGEGAVQGITAADMCALENQGTTQYRVCGKRVFLDAFGPWGSQNDGARLGNPAVATDIYIVQNAKRQRAAVLPNQARESQEATHATHASDSCNLCMGRLHGLHGSLRVA